MVLVRFCEQCICDGCDHRGWRCFFYSNDLWGGFVG